MRKVYILLFVCLVHTLPSFAQWNPNTSVNLELAALPVADMQSLTTSSGKTWIAFYHQNAGNYDMRAQLLDVNGVKLLGPNGVLVSNKVSGTATYVFNICKDASDNLIIGFQDQRNGGLSAVMYKIDQAGAALWGPDGIVLGDGLAPYPGALTNGEVAVAWNESTTNTLNLQKITTSGTLAWASPVIVKVGTTLTTRGQIVPNLAGTFNMIFQKRLSGISTLLYSQRYDNNGNPLFAAPVQLGTETTSGARYYSVTAENDTTYCGYYSSPSSRFNSWLQRINPDGAIPYGINGSNFSTNTLGGDPYQQNTNMALNPGSPYVWSLCSFSNTLQSQYGVYVQKFLKSTGARLLGAGALNIYPISANFDSQVGNVSLVNDAPVFMSYDVNYKIYATRLDANGAFVWSGNRIELSSTTAGGSTPKGRFGFTALNDHEAVALWYENRGLEYRAYAQDITPGGLFSMKVATQNNVPATISTPAGTLQMIDSIFPLTASQAAIWSIVPGTGSATISVGGLVTAVSNGTVWAKAVSVVDATLSDSMQLTLSNQSNPVTSIVVSTQGSVPAVINTNGGTLQMIATLLPVTVNQAVTWSIVPVTGTATISTTGLVTAVSNGTVWAKAVSVASPSMKDSMLITISNQTVPVTSLIVSTQGSVPAVINTNGGTLQMIATILPATANQAVTWSIVPVTGTASISATGLVTAISNGTVWAKAVSVQTPSIKDSMLITISNQIVPITSLIVSTQGSVPAVINTNGGTLQMVATILPATANQAVTWSIVPVTGTASISAAGLVTAITNGTVWAKAVSVQTPSIKDSMLITISNQIVPITSLIVSTQGSVPAVINTNGGTLQMVATILPATANQAVTWSIVPVTGTATISASGLVTAVTNGTVWAKAVSVQTPSIKDSMLITISNQTVPITALIVSTQGAVPAVINTIGGTLQMIATILPATANQAVTWSIVPVTGSASIGATGLVTAITNGTVWAKAVSVQTPSMKDSMLISISNQSVTITSLIVSTQGGVPAVINSAGGNLLMVATILPIAANQAVTWSIVPVTGTATINAIGLVTPITNGTVWAKAVSVQIPSMKDSMLITINFSTALQNADPSLSKMKLYPVPAGTVLYLKLLQNHPAMSLYITDALGRHLYEEALPANALSSLHSINIDRLPGGFYLLNFVGNGIKARFKFEKK